MAYENLLLLGDASWTDYDVEVEAMPVKRVGEFDVVFRVVDNSTFGYAVFGGWDNRSHAAAAFDANQWHAEKVVPGSIHPGQWHRVKIEVRGQNCSMILDGKQVLQVTNGKFAAAGKAGLRTGSSAVRFRNLRITDPQGKVLLEGFPPLPTAVVSP